MRILLPDMHNYTMNDEVDAFIYRYSHDVDSILRDYLENLKDDLRSEDAPIRAQAEKLADQILDWLLPPLPPLSAQARLSRAQQAANDPTLTDEQKALAVARAARSTGRRRGRPRTDTAQHAIRALTLFYARGHRKGETSKANPSTWREIALGVKGCNHRRPNLERACEHCGDAIREAAGRLEKFLISIGHNPAA
jgi:hypothetical protein